MKRRHLAAILSALLLLGLAAPAARADFGFQSFDVAFTDELGAPLSAPGAHPYAVVTSFEFNQHLGTLGGEPIELPDGDVKDLFLTQITGLIGSPEVAPICPGAQFYAGAADECPPATQLGVAATTIGSVPSTSGGTSFPFSDPVYNLPAPVGIAQRIGYVAGGISPVIVDLRLSPDPPYNVIAAATDTPNLVPVLDSEVTLWGVPADPAHDPERGARCQDDPPSCGGGGKSAGIPPTPYITLPRACTGALETTYALSSWQRPGALLASGEPDLADPGWLSGSDPAPPFAGCENLGFAPQASAAPTTPNAASPSGFDFQIRVDDPAYTDPGEPSADSEIKKAIVTLPQGLTVNAAAANGQDACSPAQLAKESAASEFGAGCPAASKVAAVEVQTPLLTDPLEGSLFLATPYENPFDTLLAGYLVIKSPQRGIVVKLAGRVDADPDTGRLVASFDDNPQLPFSDLQVRLKAGPHAPLITPSTCGTYQVKTELYPHSGTAPVIDTDTFTIDHGPDGGACQAGDPAKAGDPADQAALPNAPSFDAGTVSPIAAIHSPFVVNLRREDGSQNFSAVTVNPPQGLVAKLAGTPACPEEALKAAESKSGAEEKANPSCPASSEVGNVFAAAGAGPDPYWAPGKAYLAGPYKGAPLSLAILTPAVAGPFDLGTVAIRTALHVNPKTAEITAVSDPIPSILEGIPLDIRSASVRLDKPNFALNGTSCDPMAVGGLLTSTLGQVASLSSRFQLAECTRLGFKPKMTLRLRGGTKRGKHPALTIALMPRPGDANIASVSVALPRSEFLENAHIRTVCTRPDFAADACPAGAIYGEATVDTPILDYDLAGHVYLRSSDNLLPDVVPDLRGPAYQPIRLETAGRTDSIRGGIRTTIDFVPDAPFTKAAVALQGGNKGLLVNSRNICGRVYRATVRYTAHNGMTHVARPALRARCGRRGGRGKKKAKRRGGRSVARRSGIG